MEQFTQEEVDKWWATISQQDKERILGAKSHFNGKHQNETDKILTMKHLDTINPILHTGYLRDVYHITK
jgi:hypothetical protein